MEKKKLAIIILTILVVVSALAVFIFTLPPSSDEFAERIADELYHSKQGGIYMPDNGPFKFLEGHKLTTSQISELWESNGYPINFCCGEANDLYSKCEGYSFDSHPEFICDANNLEAVGNIIGNIRVYCPVNASLPCIIGFKKSRE